MKQIDKSDTTHTSRVTIRDQRATSPHHRLCCVFRNSFCQHNPQPVNLINYTGCGSSAGANTNWPVTQVDLCTASFLRPINGAVTQSFRDCTFHVRGVPCNLVGAPRCATHSRRSKFIPNGAIFTGCENRPIHTGKIETFHVGLKAAALVQYKWQSFYWE